MTTFFTSDTHFGHANIMRYCPDRPGRDVDEMDAELIRRWNMVVDHGDLVFHLGDFCWNTRDPDDILGQLKGVKVLIHGNHDPVRTRRAWGWARVLPSFSYNLDEPGGPLAHLVHRPDDAASTFCLRDLRPDSGRIVLHGHTHGQRGHNPYSPAPGVRYLDVGVDTWGAGQLSYTPASEAQVIARLAARA